MCLMGNMEFLCTHCRGIGPHLLGRGKSHGFSLVAAGTWGTFSSYGQNGHLKLEFVLRHQECCLDTRDTSGISTRLGRAIRTPFEVRWETQGPFLFATVLLGFLSTFNKSQASSPFEGLNSTCLLRCQRDVRPPVQMRMKPRAFSRLSTVDSDIPSSCEMKDEPTFKPLHGNPDFFRVRASRCPFNWRQQTQGPSHIPIAEGSISCGACGKLAYLFSRSQGISSHLETVWGARNFPRVAVLKLVFL